MTLEHLKSLLSADVDREFLATVLSRYAAELGGSNATNLR
jgi:hypothetical protein